MVKIIAEIGINHNGSLETAEDLIKAAANAGCDYVKFQKRTPEICVPESRRDEIRGTPWGKMTYMEYRKRIEFGTKEYDRISEVCTKYGVKWFASVWDKPSADFMRAYSPCFYKIPSSMATNFDLVEHVDQFKSNIIISTGMTSLEGVKRAVDTVKHSNLILFQCTSSYPCSPDNINLRVMNSYREMFGVPVGYSGHEEGVAPTIAAVALGAQFIERHITLDKKMWGSDQWFSLTPDEFGKMAASVIAVERSLGDGEKKVLKAEVTAMRCLRPVVDLDALSKSSHTS